MLALGLFLLGPVSLIAFGHQTERGPWWSASRASSGLAPLPADTPEAVVLVYGARTLGWRGAFAIHTWLATKPAGAASYTVHHVIGWRFYRGGSPVVSQQGTPDFYWFGAPPELLAEHRGAAAETMIGEIETAIERYPFASEYRAWPGPNSNTFTAFIAREVPALRLGLPNTAIGKDYLGKTTLFASTPSGTGWQASLFGLLGISVGRAEGFELNLLGLSAGVDFDDLALRLPGLGKIGLSPTAASD